MTVLLFNLNLVFLSLRRYISCLQLSLDGALLATSSVGMRNRL